ncbi:MAG: hypothetical protein NZ730_13600 [Porticoccaceae bacterium]|nr:hypothetical protein [Porticoccaceae bacterium]
MDININGTATDINTVNIDGNTDINKINLNGTEVWLRASEKEVAEYIYDNYSELFYGELDYGDGSVTVELSPLTTTRQRIIEAEGMDDQQNQWTATVDSTSFTNDPAVSHVPKSSVLFINWRADANVGDHPETWEVNGSTATATHDVEIGTGPNNVGSACDIFTHVRNSKLNTITSSEADFKAYTTNRLPHYGGIFHLPGSWEFDSTFVAGDTESIPVGGMVIGVASDAGPYRSIASPNYMSDYTTFGGVSVFDRIGEWYDRVQISCWVNNTDSAQNFEYTSTVSNTEHEHFHIFKQNDPW